MRMLICCTLLCAGCRVLAAQTLAPNNRVGPEEFTATVIAVLDGDTVLVRRNGGLVKVRLAGIDAPEKAQPYGDASRLSLAGMVMKKPARIIVQAVDQYQRLVAQLDVNGLDVNAEQLRRGMAWEYSNYHSNQTLIALQLEAGRVRRGLWAQNDPTPPWKWRKLHPFVPHAVAAGCGKKQRCAEMASCEEAEFYLTQCGLVTLDGNGDGTPCEALCTP